MRALLVSLAAITTLINPSLRAAELTVVGGWTLNRDLSTMPAEGDDRRAPQGGRRGGAGGGAGGGGGRGGGGGMPGRGGMGGFGGGNGPSESELHKAEVIRRRLTEVPMRLIITRSDNGVTLVDDLGRSYTLKADGKKQERVTGDGEFTSKTRFEGTKLVVEEDFGGPKLITTYTPLLEGGELLRLEVTLKAENMPGAGRARLEGRGAAGTRPPRPEIRRIYDAEPR